ncbi:HIRA-interacting protein 3 [Perognathus longimembris pacificus]|uniref:HIRA-interacting protein 3 n=1 Tax=Perognathus longimembris pacificus TaxID=214514 RepID=UPI002018F8AD|nr:HIRA-interacting protein 3 [Perognathus longimembris pacificus]
MAREDEIREFTRSFFRGRPDLSTTTHSVVRRKYLAHVGRDHLEPEEKQMLKQLVEKELLQMPADGAAKREEKLDLPKKSKRSPNSCSDPARKRFRFNSESEPSSAASSPGCLASPAQEEENPTGASEKVVDSSDEEPQRDLRARAGSESSEEYSEGRVRKKPGTKKRQAAGKASAKQQTREDSEDSDEEPAQRKVKKSGGHRGAKSHQQSEREVEEILAKKKKNSKKEEEGKDVGKPRAKTNKESSARKGSTCKQESRAGTPERDLGDSEEEEKEAAGSEDNLEPLVQTKGVDRTVCKDRVRSGSSEEEDSDMVPATAEGTAKTTQLGSANSEDSDTEREESEGEVGTSPKGERKNRSSKKNSRKGRTRSSSSSSDGSPEPKGGKAGSGRRGEDHPAVMRLKRYIRACGAHRNYKKLLGSCRSHKERLNVLRAELEALGMKGNPSLEKCRALKEKREEAAEVASLDVANIISGSGRPRRRTAWNPSGEATTPGELYCRTLDSDEERPRQAPPDWSHMRGIISSDGESD